MAAIKEQTTAASQGVNLKSATLPDSNVEAARERTGAENAQGKNSQRELYAQLPIMPPVLLSPTGIHLPNRQTKDDGLTVRAVGAPSTAFKFDFATKRNAIFSEVAAYIHRDNAITNVESLPAMIDKLIQLSRGQGEKLRDVRIMTHGWGGQIFMAGNGYLLSDPNPLESLWR